MRRIFGKATLACTVLGVGALVALVATSGAPSGALAAPSITPIVTIPIINIFQSTVTAVSPNTGPAAGGTLVTVTGTNFVTSQPAPQVLFGTALATDVVCAKSTTCTAISPAGTGVVDITVRQSNVTSPVVTADEFTYDPIVTAISPAGGTPAGGTVVTITGADFAGPGSRTADLVFFGTTPATNVSCSSTTTCTATSPAGTGTVDVTVNVGALGSSPVSAADKYSYSQLVLTPPIVVPHGYWLVGSDGGIFSFGDAVFHGSMGGQVLQRPVVGITPTPDRGGYWLVGSDGGVFSFGDTTFYGSLPGQGYAPAGSSSAKRLAAPIVGIVPSSDDQGYFMVGSDGGVFTFGDAKFEGSCPGIGGCSGTAVAVMPDSTGNGYWLVTATGHVYNFGDAPALGSPGPQTTLVTSAVRTPDGQGYSILFANGMVTTFGDAPPNLGGPTGAVGGSNPASAIFATSTNKGYWVSAANGVVFPYGDAPNDGGISSSTHLNGPIIAASGS